MKTSNLKLNIICIIRKALNFLKITIEILVENRIFKKNSYHLRQFYRIIKNLIEKNFPN